MGCITIARIAVLVAVACRCTFSSVTDTDDVKPGLGASASPHSTIEIDGCRSPLSKIVFKIKKKNVIDLTHPFNNDSVYWLNNPSGFRLIEVFKGFLTKASNIFYSTFMISQPEHTGTHMDAPIHFYKPGVGADGVNLHDLIGPGVLVNLKQNGSRFGADSLVKIEHFKEWERIHGERIRTGSIVLIYTGFGDVYNDRTQYLGTDMTSEQALKYFRFPGLDPEAAKWLVKNRCIASVGIDTASIDIAASELFGSHQVFTAHGIPIFENVANLDQLAQRNKRFKIIALPQNIEGGSGAPLRIIAVVG